MSRRSSIFASFSGFCKLSKPRLFVICLSYTKNIISKHYALTNRQLYSLSTQKQINKGTSRCMTQPTKCHVLNFITENLSVYSFAVVSILLNKAIKDSTTHPLPPKPNSIVYCEVYSRGCHSMGGNAETGRAEALTLCPSLD